MPEGRLGVPRFTSLAELEYSVTMEPPINKSENEIENIVVGAVDKHIVPDVATRDVTSGRVLEREVPKSEQDFSVTVETDNVNTSKFALSKIEEEVNTSIAGKVTSVSVKAVPTNPVERLVDKIME